MLRAVKGYFRCRMIPRFSANRYLGGIFSGLIIQVSSTFAMRTSAILATVLAVVVATASSVAGSTILVSKYTPETNGLLSGFFSENLRQESHLPVALFQETNTTFDLKLYESFRTTAKPPIIVSFLLV